MIFVYAVFMELFCVFILNFVCYIVSFMSEVYIIDDYYDICSLLLISF